MEWQDFFAYWSWRFCLQVFVTEPKKINTFNKSLGLPGDRKSAESL